MKKLSALLSWVLVLAFALTMFSGAVETASMAYTDSDTLTPAGEEAVAVLTALGIVNGYTDGTFGGTANVTRAEFAKMISLASAGDDVADFYAAATLPFSDHFDDWCIPYVNFCYLNGIIAGYGDGTMLPKNNVTGFEAVKMTLVALGYDPETEGLVGSQWQSNTARLARRIGLLENLESANFYSAFNREATAILVRNAIYTDTVEYVGGSAVESGLTLGEEVYDLLDIRGIVVANQYTGSFVTWTDVLSENGQYNKSAVIAYDAANEGQTRFAYRDYSDAATVGGYYVPRVLTAEVYTDNEDIGRAFRVLTTGAQNPANTSEVRKVYGIVGEIDSDDEYTFSIEGIGDVAFVDSACYFINGKQATKAEAEALRTKQSATTAPWYYWVDNNADGIVDTVYMFELGVAKVMKKDDETGKLTLSGVGTAQDYIDLSTEDVAAGDYVVYGGDQQYSFVRKLDIVEGRVTGYSENSGATAHTAGGGSYTINGAKYTFGALAEMLDDISTDTDYFEDLLGEGTAALYGPTFRFLTDGSYIVAVFTTEESYWSNYAMLVDSDTGDVMLGMPSVQLYTDDNEYKEFYVASFNGTQIYDTVTSGGFADSVSNIGYLLVCYEEVGDHTIALYTADYVNTGSHYKDWYKDEPEDAGDYSLGFNTTTGNWEDENGAPYTWDNATVFVGTPNFYGGIIDPGMTADGNGLVHPSEKEDWIIWRAYRKGEFQPLEDDFTADKCMGGRLVYADGLNGVATIKTAALLYWEYYLPGLVLRSDAIWGTIMSATSVQKVTDSEDATAKYAYTVKILKPYSTSTETVTIYADSALNTFKKGDIYKLYMSEDGICRRFEHAGTKDDNNYWYGYGDNYIELDQWLLSYVESDGADGYWLHLKDPYMRGYSIAEVDDITLHMGPDADAYFVKNLFTDEISAWNQLANTTSLGNIKLTSGLTVYADINETTLEVYSIWFDDADDPWTMTYKFDAVLESYNVNTREAVYNVTDLSRSEGVANYKVTLTQDPNELFCPVGSAKDNWTEVTATLEYNMHGQWEITKLAPSDNSTWTTYSKKNAQTVVWESVDDGVHVGNLLIWTPDTGNTSSQKYLITENTQIFWFRENFGRVDGIAGKPNASLAAGKLEPASFYLTTDEAVNEFINANGKSANSYLAYNADGDDSQNDAYNYEKLSVLSDKKGNALIIVLIDTDHTNAPEAKYPYADIERYIP